MTLKNILYGALSIDERRAIKFNRFLKDNPDIKTRWDKYEFHIQVEKTLCDRKCPQRWKQCLCIVGCDAYNKMADE